MKVSGDQTIGLFLNSALFQLVQFSRHRFYMTEQCVLIINVEKEIKKANGIPFSKYNIEHFF